MPAGSALGRYLNIVDYALVGLARKRGKNLAVVLLFTLVVFLISSFQLLMGALQESARTLLAVAPEITVQQLSAGRQVNLEKSMAGGIETIPGVRRVRERIWGYYFDETSGANYTVIGVPPQDLLYEPALSHSLMSGRLPGGSPGETAVGVEVPKGLDLGGRSHFSLFRPDLSLISMEVVGRFSAASSLLTADLLLLSLDDARDLFALPVSTVTDLLVEVANPLEIDTVARKIADRYPSTRVLTRGRIEKTYKVVFGWRSGLGTVCLVTVLGAFAIFAWDKAQGLSAEERREIGILKMLGWQTGDIILLRFFESGVVALLAFVSGYLLAWAHLLWGQGWLFRPVMLGWSVLRPELVATPVFALWDLLQLLAISVLPYLAATAFPAWRAGVIRPESVL